MLAFVMDIVGCERLMQIEWFAHRRTWKLNGIRCGVRPRRAAALPRLRSLYTCSLPPTIISITLTINLPHCTAFLSIYSFVSNLISLDPGRWDSSTWQTNPQSTSFSLHKVCYLARVRHVRWTVTNWQLARWTNICPRPGCLRYI